jgi:prephenate dehydrogenase
MKVVVIGIGLIGGSMAWDIKKAYAHTEIAGIDTNSEHVKKAIELGLISSVGDEKAIKRADVVILSIPVDTAVEVLPHLLDTVSDQAVVIDVGSTKSLICKKVQEHPKRRNYLACHPIAGTEFSGPTAAMEGLFNEKTNIICEVEKTAFKLQEKALDIFSKLGMRIRYMNPEAHDKHIAYMSHLSHISSFMLGKTVIEKEKNERDIFDMAGSGFESTVRLAKSSPAMWTPIFEQNKENVVETLKEYIQNLEEFKQKLIKNDFDGIFKEMDDTNKIKEILKGMPQNKI